MNAIEHLLSEIAGHLAEHPACIGVRSWWSQGAYRMRATYRDQPGFKPFPLQPISDRIKEATNCQVSAEWFGESDNDHTYQARWNIADRRAQ